MCAEVAESDKGCDASTIARVLEDDDLLAKVFNCLVEDGLQECRLVCRRWRDVCRTLPVSVSARLLSDVADWAYKFPNAESFKFCDLRQTERNRMIPQPVEEADAEAGCLLSASYLKDIARFTHLKHLSLLYPKDAGVPEEIENCFSQLTQLESFELITSGRFDDGFVPAFVYLPQCLRHLTKLTRLTWILPSSQSHPDFEPLTSLKEITELCLSPNVLTNKNGDFLFPSLTSLEEISFRDVSSSDVKHLTEITNVLLPYSTSLRSLEVGNSQYFKTYRINKSCIRSFPLLECLSLQTVAVDDGTDFVDHILGMDHLRKLKIDWPDRQATQNCVRLSALSKLQALILCSRQRALPELSDILKGVNQLTRLSVVGAIVRDMSSLKNMTALVNLYFNANLSFAGDLVEILTPLKRMEQLTISDPAVQFPSEAVKHMKNLKAIRVTCLRVDDSFGCTLASLSQLTCLTVDLTFVDASCLKQINKIKNLVDLDLSDLPDLPNFPVLDGKCLSRLRYLNINENLSDRAFSEVKAAFPCLRSLTLLATFPNYPILDLFDP